MIYQVLILIWVGGKMLSPQLSRQVRSLSLSLPKNKGKSGKFTILDPMFSILDSNIFQAGQKIAFLCGWKHELVPIGPFIVKNYSVDCSESGETALVVDFQDPSHKMNKKQKQTRWVGTPASILKQIAATHDFGYDIDEIKGVTFTEDYPLIQANMTDAALIQRLALRYGYVWGVQGNNLVFKAPLDLETAGTQTSKEVPVLRYKHGDHSLMSFSPEIKFSRGGKRKSKKVGGKNIDLTDPMGISKDLAKGILGLLPEDAEKKLNGMLPEDLQEALGDQVGDFSTETEASSESLSEVISNVGSLFNLEGAQQADDESLSEIKPNTDNSVFYKIKEYEGIFERYTKPTDKKEKNSESDVGSPSGAASPPNLEEAKRRQVGKIIRSAEIITGTIRPTIASMYYTPKMAVVLAGLGKRLSTRYEINEVTQVLSGESDIFLTEMKAVARKFGPAPKDKKKINAPSGSGESPVPGTQDTSTGQPSPPRRYAVDGYSGDVVRKVDGENDVVVSTVQDRKLGQ